MDKRGQKKILSALNYLDRCRWAARDLGMMPLAQDYNRAHRAVSEVWKPISEANHIARWQSLGIGPCPLPNTIGEHAAA